ncbi:unnamed protein product [Alopecurus aequalis]
MGSAEDEFTPLSELTDEMDNCKVRVRISRLWESFSPKNGIIFGLDSLLIDDQGNTMQARVYPNDIDLFEDRLVEGKVYALSDFTVQDTRESYMSCSNEWTIYFRRGTVVNEIEGDIDSIPVHSFEFVNNFKDLRSWCDNKSLLTDVMGHIVSVGKPEEVSTKSCRIEFCDATIRDLSYHLQRTGPEWMRVESSHSVCSTTSSKYYLDLDIPEVQKFRENLRIQQANPIPKKSRAQKLAESWRTIKQIKSLDPEEYDEDTMFLCRVSLTDIDCTSGWCYLGCNFCQKSLGRVTNYRYLRYKLKAKVQDATGTMKLMIFCEVAEELVGVSAEELVDKIKDDDDWYTLPEQIEDLLGSTHTFEVFDKYGDGSFSVNWIMDDVSVPAAVAATTTQCKGSATKAEASATKAEARSKSTRLQKPNKRLRGEDWIN